jgi:hypothetical protein
MDPMTNSDYFPKSEKLVIIFPLQIRAVSGKIALHIQCRIGLIVVPDNISSGTCVSEANES